ncbi:hypothetical protein [Asticcacaulis sp.]|uniref:hypothetical protein n=1 Tax=Asticcacaulis sp. TaxID=1872648 RepID=UPI003F7C4D97
MKRPITAITAVLIAAALPLTAIAAPDIAGRMVNHPAADQWGLFGTGEKHELVKDTTVRGGAALQVTSAGKGANPWDIQAGISNSKSVKKGDVVLLAFWGRAVTPASAAVPAVVQQSAAPYTRIGEQNLTLTPDWRLHYVTAIADQDYPAGTLGVSVQLATGAQTVALGPVFLLDFGPGYDPKFLPRNIP